MLAILKEALEKWSKDRGTRTAGALAFFTVLSLSPLLLLSVSVAGILFSDGDAKAQLIDRIASDIGPAGAQLVEPMLKSNAVAGKGIVGSIISLVILGVGASGLFGQLQQAFNDIWRVPEPEKTGIAGAILAKLSSMLVALVAACALLASMALSVISATLKDSLPLPPVALKALDGLLSLFFMSFVIALLFKKIPRIQISWRDALPPALLTALLFVVGKIGLGIYFAQTAAGSAYGAAGSLFVVLLWLFYIWQILLFGAEVCYVYAHRQGSLASTTSSSD